MISPWSPRGAVTSEVYDHTTVLKRIEWRWNLRALTVRDSAANNLAEALDFDQTKLIAPRFSFAPGPYGGICPTAGPSLELEIDPAVLLQYAPTLGFPIP